MDLQNWVQAIIEDAPTKEASQESIEAWLTSLRRKRDEYQTKLMLALMYVEEQLYDKSWAYKSFDHMITVHAWTKPSDYRSWRQGLDAIEGDIQQAMKIGYFATRAVPSIPEDGPNGGRSAFLAKVAETAEEDHKPLASGSVSRHARTFGGPLRTQKSQSEIVEALRTENAALKHRVKVLEREIAERDTIIAQLRGDVA